MPDGAGDHGAVMVWLFRYPVKAMRGEELPRVTARSVAGEHRRHAPL